MYLEAESIEIADDLDVECLDNVCVCVCARALSCDSFVAPWTGARQASLSMGFSRQEYWSGLPFPLPGDLPDPGIEPVSLMSPALAGGFFATEPPGKPHGRLGKAKSKGQFLKL